MPSLNEIQWLRSEFSKILNSRIFPDPVDYVESVRYLPAELTTKPGYYDYDYMPYLKEIVNHFNPLSPTRKVIFRKPAQIGASTGILEAIISYYIGCVPRPMLYISADKELVETAMTTKIERLLDSCNLRDRIFSQTRGKTRRTGDTKLAKDFPGGFLHAIGARNAAKLAQMSYPVILMDELDRFPDEVGGEGDPVALAENRSNAYSSKRKLLYLSTPGVLQTSKIERLYRLGDQKHFYIKCPRCGKYIVMQWHILFKGKHYGIKFQTDNGILIPESVYYQCQECKGKIFEKEKNDILLTGEWRPTAKTTERGLVSYWMDAVYSPPRTFSWVDMCYAWLKAWDINKNKVKDMQYYRSFRNTQQGKGFMDQGESITYERVISRRRHFYITNQIPNTHIVKECGSPILLLIASVDVQKDGIYLDVKGYTERGCTWTIDFRFIEGEVKIPNKGVWIELEEILTNKHWEADDGRIYKICTTFIDSGHEAKVVYDFCKNFSSGVYPCKGDDRLSNQITFKQFNKETLDKEGLSAAFHVNTYKLKDAISACMNKLIWESGNLQPSWFPNFADDLKDSYFKMFTSEHKMKVLDKQTNRFKKWIWKQTQEENHGFDTYVYNLAALEFLADAVCRDYLNIQYLDYAEFWKYAKTEVFIIK